MSLMLGVAGCSWLVGFVWRWGEVCFGQGVSVTVDQSGGGGGVAVDRGGSAPHCVSVSEREGAELSWRMTSHRTVSLVVVLLVSRDR